MENLIQKKQRQDLNAVSDQLQARTDGIAYLINVFTELQKIRDD